MWVFPFDSPKDRPNIGYYWDHNKIQEIDATTIIDGHWKPYSKKEFLAEIS